MPHRAEQASAVLTGTLGSRTVMEKDRCFKKISISVFLIEKGT